MLSLATRCARPAAASRHLLAFGGSLPRYASSVHPVEEVDALIVGGGIMSCSVGLMLKLLEPGWKIRIVEQADRVGAECSNEWRNAGTGHAALCEPNYTPMGKDGEVDISKAVAINQKFMMGLQWWSWLVQHGVLPSADFIQPAPHCTFVHTEKDREWLRKRYEKLKVLPSFADMEYTEDYDKIKEWAPLLCSGRARTDPIACTRHPHGTECNFGLLTRYLAQSFSELGGQVQMLSIVNSIEQQADKSWLVGIKKEDLSGSNTLVKAKIVFAGAGGGTLRVLQKASMPEVKGYAGMPVSGKFLVCQNPEIVEKHRSKVYAPAAVGAPPMSVPHLDWRTIYGRDCIFFGPFAGFKPTVFSTKGGLISGFLDWMAMLNAGNILPLVKTSFKNLGLVMYLLKELGASKQTQLGVLRGFVPDAKAEDWTMVEAGQRITTVHPDGTLQFGTEVVASKDKTLIGLLGASPGASVSPHIALEVLDKFQAASDNATNWHIVLSQMIPSYGKDLNSSGLYDKVFADCHKTLLEGQPTAKKNIGAAFTRLDTDGSGSISSDEMRAHLNSLGVDRDTVEVIIGKLDADSSGDISKEEFTAGFASFITGQFKK